ncbi:hypothetical protein [Streptomyces silvensis]|uniref:DNA primase/polymerase bifunctional N-terminal domain-containing protein n=1 Tax=Streptomyces silvensis TaxID=1765722 RepID=A0A0W7XB00_9ACTN|nr:hypothetical protein [Streptomyces silvensis]KUF20045.1 hypothetical protein AT728_28060 [Streptomyces silvensis]
MTMFNERQLIAEWFAGAHPAPRRAEAEWAHHGVALLPLGVRFDALRIPAPYLHAAIGSDHRETVGISLDDWLRGPVVRDVRTGSGSYYVLIAPGAPWKGQGTAARLGPGVHLAVPRIGEQVSPVTFWASQPERPGQLCAPAHLAALLATAESLRVTGS